MVPLAALALLAIGLFAWDRVAGVSAADETFWVPSPAMEPTYEVGDIVGVQHVDPAEIARGDVVILREPPGSPSDLEMSIKRVVAVAGDEIGPTSPEGGVLLNGRPLDEPYRSPAAPTRGLTALVVPEGHVFVMGDNRDVSADSRVNGPVSYGDILGRVVDG